MSNRGANMIKHVFEMELLNILSTLDKFEHWIRTDLITNCDKCITENIGKNILSIS